MAILVSAILSGTILVFVDLLDSLGNLLRTAAVAILSGKLSKDLRFEYNYGIGKIEAIASLFCDGLVFFGLLSTLGLSVYSLIFPVQPSDFVIAVVGVKVINVSFDVVFFAKQHKILKAHHSAISKTNAAAALAALLFDSITLLSLLIMWLLRNNPIGGYISPVISIFVALYSIGAGFVIVGIHCCFSDHRLLCNRWMEFLGKESLAFIVWQFLVLQSLNIFLYNYFYNTGMSNPVNIGINFIANMALSLFLTWGTAQTITPLTNAICKRINALLWKNTF